MSLFASSYKPQVCFRPDGFNPVVLAETKNLKVILACFEAGQAIPVHALNSDLTATVLEGAGILTAGSEEHDRAPGGWAFVPAGEPRGIRAQTRLVCLFAVSPPPTAAEHAAVPTRSQP